MRAFLLSISLILAIDIASGYRLFAQETKGRTEDKSEGKTTATPLSGKQIRKLVADLGHDDWYAREAASRKLKQSGRKAMPILKQTYIETRDPDITYRIKSLAPSYFESAIYGGYPFIGITLLESVEPSVELGGGRAGIVVYDVLPGLPAEAAGMRKKDVIVSFAKHKVTPAHRSRHHLASWVGECKVGQEVDVGILREGKPMRLRVRVGGVWPNDPRPLRDLKWMVVHDCSEQFDAWWKTHFEMPRTKREDRRRARSP